MIEDTVFQEPSYNEETTFNSSVANLFANFSSGASGVTSITQGNGISCNPNPIISTGTISINAEINDLNGVSISSAQTNQSLVYDGANWVNKAMSGSCPIAFTALTDTPNSLTGRNNNLIVVNSSGTSVTTINNDYKNSIVAGSGIDVIESTNAARILLNAGSLLENFTSNNADRYVIEDSSGNNRRIRQSNIDNSGFRNDSNYISLSSLTADAPISFTTFGTSRGVFSLTSGPSVDFNSGVSGILPIEHGGTSAGTSAGARENLGLVYNVNILSQSGPSFDNTLFGDNIFLQPSFFGLSIGTSGSGYTTSDATLILSPYENIGISITAIGVGGGISTFTTNGGASFLGRGNYPDGIETWSVNQAGGVGGTFSVTPEINYINFGISTGSDGIGFRNHYGDIEIKQNNGLNWQTIFPITTSKIEDIITTGVSLGDILIYNGTSWESQTVTGAITIDHTGGTSYAGSINPGLITTTGSSITVAEFSTLSGMSSSKGTIQEQLDDKVGTSGVAPVYGDLIYYTDASTTWQPLSIGASRKILTTALGTSVPSYEFLHDILLATTSSGLSPASQIEVAVMSGTSSTDLAVPMYSILQQFTEGVSCGIDIDSTNSILELNLGSLPEPGVSLNGNDELAYHSSLATTTNKITLTNFCENISGSGLCSTAGVIDVNFTGTVLALGVYDVGTSPSGVSGNLAYFNDGDAGQPCLGVHDGTCWRVVSLGSGISTS
jgi:hypothetical protein